MTTLQIKYAPSSNMLASAEPGDITIVAGWTVLIPAATAVKYVKQYDDFNSPTAGFSRSGDKVILTHGPAKLTLDQPQAAAIVQLIKDAYKELF